MSRGGLNEIPFYTSLNKPILVMGAERELMMTTALISLTMIFVALTFTSAVIGTVVWLVVSWALRSMGKKDPMMSKIYLKHIKYKKFYPALASAYEGQKK